MTVDAVCVGAHPDDVEIGMGGTVAGMVRRGLAVAIVDLTDGEPTPHGTRERRLAEAGCAAGALGARRVTLDLPNRYLLDSVESRTALAQVIRELRPRLLFAPFPVDAHPDHVAASAITDAARFYAKFTKTGMRGEPHYPARIYRYMSVHLRMAAKPSFIADIGEDLARKVEALECYRSQFEDNQHNAGVVPMVESMARMWGGMARLEAGEPFFAVEEVGVRAVEDLL